MTSATASGPDLSRPAADARSQADDVTGRIGLLFLRDFVVTTLLRQGRGLRGTELASAAEGFQLSRGALAEGLEGYPLLTLHGREWNLATRLRREGQSREERARQPLESTLDELLRDISKPLPLAVIVRELSFLRGELNDALRVAAGRVLSAAPSAIEVGSGIWLHQCHLLEARLPGEAVIIRENRLAEDPDFGELRNLSWPDEQPALADQAAAVLQRAARPVSLRMLGFLQWQHDPANFDALKLARCLADRSRFYYLIGGLVTLQSQLPRWQDCFTQWAEQASGRSADQIDVAAALRQRLAAGQVKPPSPGDLTEIEAYARQSNGQPLALTTALMDVLEMEPDDPEFVAALQGLNDSLRSHPAFLSAGIGRYLLREAVPPHVGEVPHELLPVHLSVRDPETDEPLDMDITDEGLEGDAAEFVHAPDWEDVSEEVEVRQPRRAAGDVMMQTRYVVLNHHYRAGTIKLRRMDEDFFAVEGPLARLSFTVVDDAQNHEITGWASRESGLIYGLGDWYRDRIPVSGGVLVFTRDAARHASAPLQLALDQPDKATRIEPSRVEDLVSLREAASYMSLFELLQTVMQHHQNGLELPGLWAEINAVRRTSKRLMCSVLSAYHCFYFKQRGPKQILWRFDDGKLDQGFKRNKRKYVRR